MPVTSTLRLFTPAVVLQYISKVGLAVGSGLGVGAGVTVGSGVAVGVSVGVGKGKSESPPASGAKAILIPPLFTVEIVEAPAREI